MVIQQQKRKWNTNWDWCPRGVWPQHSRGVWWGLVIISQLLKDCCEMCCFSRFQFSQLLWVSEWVSDVTNFPSTHRGANSGTGCLFLPLHRLPLDPRPHPRSMRWVVGTWWTHQTWHVKVSYLLLGQCVSYSWMLFGTQQEQISSTWTNNLLILHFFFIFYFFTKGQHYSSKTVLKRGQRQRSTAVRHLQGRQVEEGHCSQWPKCSCHREWVTASWIFLLTYVSNTCDMGQFESYRN